MRLRCLTLVAVLALLPGAAAAQNREHLQMTADLRMLHEQVNRLQLTVNKLIEQVEANDASLDETRAASQKTFADQKIVIDQITGTLSTMREKLDDNTTRVSQLTQEFSQVREGLRLMWRSSQGLMDKRVEREVLAKIDATLKEFQHPTIRFDHISSRRSGSRRFVHLHMHMPASWTLGRAAAVRASVEQALMSAVPGLRATIELLPSDVEAHSQDEEDLI